MIENQLFNERANCPASSQPNPKCFSQPNVGIPTSYLILTFDL